MKTLKLFFIASLLTFSANAQITKGNWMVGGTGNFQTYKSENKLNSNNIINTQTGKALSIQPNIGYFLMDGFAVGLSPTFSLNTTNNEDTLARLGIGALSRYYLLDQENLINILTQVDYFISPSTKKSDYNVENFGIKAGPVLYFNESVALELTLDYKMFYVDSNFGSTKTNSFNVGLGFQIHLKK